MGIHTHDGNSGKEVVSLPYLPLSSLGMREMSALQS